jgi:hypothetical protein
MLAMIEMETALYYTFSTIAQTLAGVLGLFAAFLALRINAFNHVIYERMHDLQQGKNWGSSELLGHFGRGDAPAFFGYFRGQFEEVKAQAGTSDPPQQVLDQGEAALLTQAEGLLERKAKLLRAAQRVIVASATVIIFSFIMLMNVPWVKDCTGIAVLLLFLGVAGAAGCVVWYVLMILTALREA